MTIIAGFQCQDGLLMCADSEQTLSPDAKNQVRKIYLRRSPFADVAIGGAGDGALIEYIQQALAEDLVTARPDRDSRESWLNEYAQAAFKRHIQPYAGFPHDLVPEVEFLIGVRAKDGYQMYKWERNFAWRVLPLTHASIGSGTLQSETLINETQVAFPATQMLLYAVRLMFKVKQLVPGCGGRTEAVLLHNQGAMIPFGSNSINEIEKLVEEIDDFWLMNGLAFISGALKGDQRLLEHSEELRKLQARYKALIPEIW